MRHPFVVLLLSALALFGMSHLGSSRAQGKKTSDGIEGVKGTVYHIDCTKNKDTKLTVQSHDTIVFQWNYPISPPMPKSAKQKSSDPDVVKGAGVHHLVNVNGPVGVGRLSAVFHADKKGKTTLSFDIHGKDDLKFTCEVEVK